MKVHKYDTNKNSATLCNISNISDKAWYDSKVNWLSSSWKKVTCKNCIRIMKGRKRRPSTTFDRWMKDSEIRKSYEKEQN